MNKGRKISGGKYHKPRKKKKYELGRQERLVKLGKEKRKKIKVRGGNEKIVLLSTNIANLLNKKTKKAEKVRIKNVLETPSNSFLARQNIMMKGAVIETEKGKAKITNRPGQEGSVQAVLID
ncbi:MAG: 30S ribosomal protein S8e [Nanoarchaeota archaeon]